MFRKSLISKLSLEEKRKSSISKLSLLLGDDVTQIKSAESIQRVVTADVLIENLSFTHIAELIKIKDALKRSFYELECIRGNWSVRELKRQIASLYYERSELSENKKKMAELVQQDVERTSRSLTVRDPYVFEFLGLKSREVMCNVSN